MDGYKFIDKIGIELEAAWKEPKKGLVIDESFSPADFSPEFKGVGELVSRPIASKEEMLNWLHTNWPDETCAKCAMHVHFSLNHINYYSACMSSRFYDFFLNEMEKWGKNYNCRNELFWGRLRGDNRYCRKRFNPDVQVKYREKGHNRQDRRDHWNFCWGLHKTMECRLLPMFKNIDTAKSAIFALINCIETYLEQYTQEEKHVVDELFDFDCVPEEREVYTEEYEARYQELANTPGLSPEQMGELRKLMDLRKISKGPKREKSKFEFNYFEIYNPRTNNGVQIRSNKFDTVLKKLNPDEMAKNPTKEVKMNMVNVQTGRINPPYHRKGAQIIYDYNSKLSYKENKYCDGIVEESNKQKPKDDEYGVRLPIFNQDMIPDTITIGMTNEQVIEIINKNHVVTKVN